MSDNKSRDIFYGVVAIATLIVALIGATLAYFSITVNSAEGAVNAHAAVVSISYEDGQQVIAQAENLIPVDFNIMQQLYRRNLEAINEQANTEVTEGEAARKNLCKDGANDNYEVCSIYRFSVSNDTEIGITAALRTENNEFSDLYYGVRDQSCTATAENENNCWLDLSYDDNRNPIKYVRLGKCSNGTDDVCYTGEDEKTYTNLALRPVFGYTSYDDPTFKSVNIAAAKHSYDVVLFILNKDENQNYDQGKSYSGTILVETTNESAGQIKGSLN